jgi:hypothetical protein
VHGEYKGYTRVTDALKAAGLDLSVYDDIVTSLDPRFQAAQKLLAGVDVPPGTGSKMQLPIVLGGTRPVFTFIDIGLPDAVIPAHVHRNECLWRIVVSGSIIFNGSELRFGDWMYVPKGKQYSYTVGRLGAVLLHTYNGTALWGWEKR